MADKKTKNSTWTKIADNILPDATKKINAIDFIEGPGGTGIVLRPVQRVLVKALFAVPFDYRPKWADAIENWGMVEMWNPFRDELLRTVTEEEYLHIVHEEGRCNVGDWRDIPPRGFNEAVVFCGRRGGKSEVVAAIAAMKLYLTLCINSPQKFFGLAEGSKIDFTFLAQDETGAGRLFQKLQAAVTRATWFHTYIKDNNAKNLTFTCEADRHHKVEAKPSIQVVSLPCLEEHELVWSEGGLAEIGADVQVGDIVLDVNANQQRVTHKQYNEKEVWALETENFRCDPLLLTPNHTCIFVPATEAKSALPYLVDRKDRRGAIDSRAKHRFTRRGKFNFHWSEGPASDVVSGDYLLFPRIPENRRKAYIIDNAAAETQPHRMFCFGHEYVGQKSAARVVPAFQVSPLVCRLWGLYLAEGCIAKNDAGVNWDFHIDEKPTLAKFVQDILLSEFGLPSTIVDKEGNGCRVMCGSVQLARGFKRIFGKGCAEKSIPTEALYWPSECQKFLIQGWLEGDGCKDRAVGPTVSRKLAYSLFALGVQAGLLPSVKHKKPYTDKRGVFHRESWYVNFNKRERHYRFFQKIGDQDFYWSKVLRNAPTGRTVRVVDISVENTESFLTKLAAVHNCTTNAVRGPSSLFLALDEFAHFRSEVGSTSEDMYVAATPAAGDFHHDEIIAPPVLSEADFHQAGDFKHAEPVGTEGKVEIQDSLILSISSPLKKVGMMYDLYRMAMEDGINEDNPTFALSCSSAEMNPKLKAGFLRDKARKNPLTFKAEYGGQFLESTESFVRSIDIITCTDVLVNGKPEGAWDNMGKPMAGASIRENTTRFNGDQVGYNYFWGLDLGGVNVTDPDNSRPDGCALAIGHLEVRQSQNPTPGLTHGFHLVYDYIDRMIAGEQFEGPGVNIHTPDGVKYTDFQLLPVKDILLWLKEMNKVLPCFKGSTDQHAGRQLITLLEQNEVNNMELVNLTPAINSEMAYALRSFINDHTANFPYVPKFIHEIKMVETDVVAKYRIRVHAPLEKGAHDDMVDAVMLVALQVQQWLIDEGHLKMDPTGQSLIMQRQQALPKQPIINVDAMSISDLKASERAYQMAKFKFGGGSHRVARGRGRRF